jgi:two-component system sensor histidine kinase DegS
MLKMNKQTETKIRFYESQLQNFYEIGKALSSEKDIFKLLDLIISNSITLTSSDAGTIYLVIEKETGNPSFLKGNHCEEKLLKFAIAKNQSMNAKFEESVSPITPQSICGYTAITGLPLKIKDAYAIRAGEEYCHNQNYDLETGYITKSVLSIPMKTQEDKVMGVIQLINKKKPGVGKIDFSKKNSLKNIIPYDSSDELVMISLAGQATVVIENNLLYRDREILLENYKQQNAQLEILSRNVLKAHEEERKRIAREIHDGPAQSIVNLSLEVEICKKYLQTGNTEKFSECLNDLNNNIKATIREIRTIIYNLKPSYLDDGLLKALENHFHNFSANTGINVQFLVPNGEINLEYYLSSTIYRIVQEALTNIYKHADAKRVEVHIWSDNGKLILTIVDDGKGFDPAMLPSKDRNLSETGFGLEGMRERAELIKGAMSVQSKPGEGAKIRLEIPLNYRQEVPR